MQRLPTFHGLSKLRKAAMQLLVKQMSESNYKDLKTAFEEMDQNRTGTISKSELKRGLS